MKKNGTSDAPSMSPGSIEDDEENDVGSERSEEPSEEEIEELSEEIVYQPSSDNKNDFSKKLIEEPDEGSDYDPSEDSGYQSEQPDEVLNEEEEVEQREETDHNDTDYQFESVANNSNEKKRSLDAKDGDYNLAKKCKPDQSLEIESDTGSAHTTHNLSQISEAFTSDAIEKNSEGSGKRRRSRWDPQPECSGEGGETDRASKKRKSRWEVDSFQLKMLGPIQLPDFVTKLGFDLDPEIQQLKEKLTQINQKLQSEVHDDRPIENRSPSPPPIYDNFGIRRNTRDVRFREKLMRDRQIIIASLIEKNPTFNPPTDYKPPKLYKRLYIPVNEYPGYNFIGLIIGPRGNTLKGMEKESGAKIVLRGKGSKKTEQKTDPSDDDDLHVLIEADNQKSLDDAVGMVEKLLIPVDEGINEHKRAQLRELARLNGSVNLCRICGEDGHMACACPNRTSLLNDVSPVTTMSTTPGNTFTTEFGVSPASTLSMADDTNLFVRYLPNTVDDGRLREIFTPYGRIIEAKVIKDRNTGGSKGYGFVKYENLSSAASAVAGMNGFKIDGKTLAVKSAGKQPTPTPTPGPLGASLLGSYPGPGMVPQDGASPVSWPGPPGSMLQSSSNNFNLPHSSVFSGHSDSSSSEWSHSSHKIPVSSSPLSLDHFPGNPDYRSSQFLPYVTPPPSSFPPEVLPSSNLSPFSWTPIAPPGNGSFHYP